MERRERLLDQLRGYVATDASEAEHCRTMLELLETADDAFSRSHFVPGHFTASCYIVDIDGRLLLHHHRRLNRWLQMGGHVEADESPDLAALREGREESGLRDLVPLTGGIFDLDIHPIPAAKGEPDHAHFDIRYLALTKSPEAAVVDRAESNDLAWVTLEHARELMPDLDTVRVLQKIERFRRERSAS